jgi:hypothetical protein
VEQGSDWSEIQSRREDWQIVRAGPASPVGLKVPSRRRWLAVEHIWTQGQRSDPRATREFTVILTLELRQSSDGVYTGPYDLRSLSIEDRDGRALTPEFVRSLPLSTYITQACQDGDRVVLVDETGLVTDHRDWEETLRGDDLIVAYWLRSRISNSDTNKDVARLLHIKPAAAAQRISRLRAAGKLPPAETRGERR